MAITKEYQNWPDKPWNATEEMWKRKAKSLEGQYQQLLSDHQEMRLEKAKLIGEVRVLRRYKESADNVISRDFSTRKMELKEGIGIQNELDHYRRKYYRECDKSAALEKENEILLEQVSVFKKGIEEQSEVEHDLKDAKKRIIRLQQELSFAEASGSKNEQLTHELEEEISSLRRKLRKKDQDLVSNSHECSALTAQFKSMEAAWDSARNENKKLLNELKKKENAIKDVQTVKAVTIHADRRIHALDTEFDHLRGQVRQRDSRIKLLQEEAAASDTQIERLRDRVRELTTTVSTLRDSITEKDDANFSRKTSEEAGREDSSFYLTKNPHKEQMNGLVQQIEDLQLKLLLTQKDYIKKLKQSENMREKQRVRDKEDSKMEALYKTRRCK